MLPTFHRPIFTFINSLFGTILIFLMCIPNIPGQDNGTQKPTRFYIGGVLSSTATARAFTMEAQVR